MSYQSYYLTMKLPHRLNAIAVFSNSCADLTEIAARFNWDYYSIKSPEGELLLEGVNPLAIKENVTARPVI